MPVMTITTTAQQAQRAAAAFGKALNLVDANGNPRNATEAEIKAYVIAHLRMLVHRIEKREALTPPPHTPTPFDPT